MAQTELPAHVRSITETKELSVCLELDGWSCSGDLWVFPPGNITGEGGQV